MEWTLAIVGCRSYDDYETFATSVDAYLASRSPPELIVSGGATGVDSLAERYASERGMRLLVVPADWATHGKAAGPKRNSQIVGMVDEVLAFPSSSSKGTWDVVRKANKAGLPVTIVKV